MFKLFYLICYETITEEGNIGYRYFFQQKQILSDKGKLSGANSDEKFA